jgi:predicted permease
MQSFLRDLRHSLRLLRSSPGFTLTAVAALALGIGTNTAIFSVVNTVLLTPIPAPEPDRVVILMSNNASGASPVASDIKFNLWREQTGAFQEVSASFVRPMNLTGVEQPEQVRAAFVTADYFRLFGLPIAVGHGFSIRDEWPAAHVVVLADAFWRRAFGGDRKIVGKTLTFGEDSYVVAGIMAPGITTVFPDPPDVWVPFPLDPNGTNQVHYFQGIARLKPGITLEKANALLQLATQEFRRRFPQSVSTSRGDVLSVQPLQQFLVKDVRMSLLTLMGAVSLVLLIACANVSNLLLVKASGRSHEVAIRTALGASRRRIARQLLTESIMLSAAGGVVGLGLGAIGIRALLSLYPSNIQGIGSQGSNVAIDWRVLAFTGLLSVATGLFFGLIPAVHSSCIDLNSCLKDGGRTGSGFHHSKIRSLLVVGEMGLALILLIGAALLIRSLIALRSVDPGFDPRHVVTARAPLDPRLARVSGVERLVSDIHQRLTALPGVEGAGMTRLLPMDGGFNSLPIIVVGRPLDGLAHGSARWMVVSPGYFEVLKIPLLRGRFFTENDQLNAPGVAILNQSLVKQIWPEGDPLNDRILIGKGMGPNWEEPPRQVVGIVGDVRENGLGYDLQPAMFIPVTQLPDSRNSPNPVAWVLRTRTPSLAVNASVQNELRRAAGGLPVAPPRSMEEIVLKSTSRQDFNMLLMSIFGGAALLLAAIGIYGVMAYSAQQRTREMGVRIALGASGADVRTMVVWQGMRLALAGVVIGIAGAFGFTRFLAGFLYGIMPWDPLVFVVAPLILCGVGLAAVWLPANRASRIDPIQALRHE